jgi:hypothetical protein
LVAVELSATRDADLQRAWKLPHSAFPEQLPSAGFLERRDGVASSAMLEMLLQLHAAKEGGAQISLVAFNGFRDSAQRLRLERSGSGQGPHEAAQAENILDAARAGTFDHILILVGEMHARKAELDIGGARFPSMAMHLQGAGAVTSLMMGWSGGSMWGCTLKAGALTSAQQPITDNLVECGSHEREGQDYPGDTQRIVLGEIPGATGSGAFDGYYWLGTISASPPAFPAGRPIGASSVSER